MTALYDMYHDDLTVLYYGDARQVLAELPAASVQCVVTSPPYWALRDYGQGPDALGQEPSPELYIEHLIEIFRGVKRVLRDDGTLWLNLGDTYYGSGGAGGDYNPGGMREGQRKYRQHASNGHEYLKPKDLVGVPWRVAFALQRDGWWLRRDIIWAKPDMFPEPVRDRPSRTHEYVFLMSKARQYYYDADAISEPARHGPNDRRNRRDVWTISAERSPGDHHAVFPLKLPRLCILAGTRPGDTVLDPFAGSGTTCVAARELGRRAIGIEVSKHYYQMAAARLAGSPVGMAI